MKKRMIALDADPLIFECTEGKEHREAFAQEKPKLKTFKWKFKNLVEDIENEISANYPGEIEGIQVILSDPNSNFRYDIFPDYKCSRPEGGRSKTFYRLRKWALKKYGYIKNVEADDVVSYYVTKHDHIGATLDKDMLRGVPGLWFHSHYMRRYMLATTEGEARTFNLIQAVTGDPSDDIPGIKGVAEKTAIKLLDKYGWDWEGVVASYVNADKPEKPGSRKRVSLGLTEEDAILTQRLVCMTQWSPKKGVKLWQPIMIQSK